MKKALLLLFILFSVAACIQPQKNDAPQENTNTATEEESETQEPEAHTESASQPTPPPSSTLVTYQHTVAPLQFKYPDYLSLREEFTKYNEITATYSLHLNLTSDEFSCSIGVNGLGTGFPGYETAESEYLFIGGVNAVVSTLNGIDSNSGTQALLSSFDTNTDSYLIFCTYDKRESYQKNRIKEMLSTFSF